MSLVLSLKSAPEDSDAEHDVPTGRCRLKPKAMPRVPPRDDAWNNADAWNKFEGSNEEQWGTWRRCNWCGWRTYTGKGGVPQRYITIFRFCLYYMYVFFIYIYNTSICISMYILTNMNFCLWTYNISSHPCLCHIGTRFAVRVLHMAMLSKTEDVLGSILWVTTWTLAAAITVAIAMFHQCIYSIWFVRCWSLPKRCFQTLYIYLLEVYHCYKYIYIYTYLYIIRLSI